MKSQPWAASLIFGDWSQNENLSEIKPHLGLSVKTICVGTPEVDKA